MELTTDIRYVKGIGETRAKALKKLGVTTLGGMVSYFPRDYEDRRTVKTIRDLTFGETVCVEAVVAGEPVLSHVRSGLDLVKLRAVDAGGTLGITFFNQPYVKKALKKGETYLFYGRVGGKLTLPEMVNPLFAPQGGNSELCRIAPVYRLTAGVTQSLIARSVRQGLEACGDVLPNPLPDGVRQRYRLAQSRFAYENVHFPENWEALSIARRRLVFEELFVLCCAMSLFRTKKSGKTGPKIAPFDPDAFYAKLPFLPTGAQRRAVSEALADMESGSPMSRLVQGDVGSGKTIVAAACCAAVCASGYQAAVMAPTSILAEQHARSLSGLFAGLGLKTVLLTGGLTAAEKRKVRMEIASGGADVIIGTHALISEDVEYDKLGLVVADEQHRFGVQQRSALTEKGESPHVLVMSATPIPRTLALIIYSDLDVSVIDELPPGRQKVDTFAVGEEMRPRINTFIRKQVSEGRQVYIVCPAVEDNETDETLKSAKEYAEELRKHVFPDLAVGCVHGKMKPRDKEKVMSDFVSGAVSILVATTVIEVGVDVPNASLMVVENADRFGLSQLHQLRGRVGRGKYRSYCVLFEGAGGDTAKQRLDAMCKTNDGFKIAETDLKLRGPGDFFGFRQSGLPEMKIASFAEDMEVLNHAKEAAGEVLRRDPSLSLPENRDLKQHIDRMIAQGAGTFN